MNSKTWKKGALSAATLAAMAAAGYVGLSGIGNTAAAQDTGVPAQPAPFGPGGGFGGRGGRGGHDHLQGLSTNPPEVELAPAQSDVEPTQATEKVEGADYYDGQYYGDAVQAGRWGTMQVVAVVENGELTDVLIAQYPTSTYESDIITRNALPTLISEAIEAQDADGVNFVSRATDSSRAFVQSLDSALLDAAIGMDL
ncbi:MAG: FMN-binding protein [Anaerolineae bacterium]|nr:FMN-binding protein [Anaerolineae bacterium]